MSCPCCGHKSPTKINESTIYCPECDETYKIPKKAA